MGKTRLDLGGLLDALLSFQSVCFVLRVQLSEGLEEEVTVCLN